MPIRHRVSSVSRDWLDWQQSLHPTPIDLGLERVSRVLARTGWQQAGAARSSPSAGTNGKGSCVALLDCDAAGARLSRRRPSRRRTWSTTASASASTARWCPRPRSSRRSSASPTRSARLAHVLRIQHARGTAGVRDGGAGRDRARGRHGRTARRRQRRRCGRGDRRLDRSRPHGMARRRRRERSGARRPASSGAGGRPSSASAAAAAIRACDARAKRRRRPAQLRGTRFRRRASDADGRGTTAMQPARLAALPVPALAGACRSPTPRRRWRRCAHCGQRLPLSRRGHRARACARASLPGRFQRIADARGFEWVLDVAHNPDAARRWRPTCARYPCRGARSPSAACSADKDVEAVVGDPARPRRTTGLRPVPMARARSTTRALAARAGTAASPWQPAAPCPRRCSAPPPCAARATASSCSVRSTPSGRRSSTSASMAARRSIRVWL